MKHTYEALGALRTLLLNQVMTIEAAQRGDHDALDYVLVEMAALYTHSRKLAMNVAQAVQTDDDEQAQAEEQREMERQEALRGCISERP
jgi:hypothetical protein